ncbi:MAG: glycosyltransferase [Candidatus Kerfeldbacteria bacterium]|nr:glycosyltransferase [Candidatus Kerfeldbacteria bacterium]
MRIALVTQAYYPVRGGVTEHVWHLGRELEHRGHQVTVITGQAKPREDRDLRVIRLGRQIPMTVNGANISITWGWKLGRALQQIEAREKFDLVHIQCPIDPGLPLIAAKSMRTVKVGTHHTFRPRNPLAELFPGVLGDAMKKVAAHIAVSPSAEWLVKKYFPATEVTVIPNGVDVDRFNRRSFQP